MEGEKNKIFKPFVLRPADTNMADRVCSKVSSLLYLTVSHQVTQQNLNVRDASCSEQTSDQHYVYV